MSDEFDEEVELDDSYQPTEEELDAYYRSLDWFTINREDDE